MAREEGIDWGTRASLILFGVVACSIVGFFWWATWQPATVATDGEGFFWLGLALAAALIPSLIARSRKHHNRAAITVTNLIGVAVQMGSCTLLAVGKTGDDQTAGLIALGVGTLFWLVALIWSSTEVHVQQKASESR